MKKEFNYVIARSWNPKEPDNLCIYTYFNEIQKGTLESAKWFLEYVKRQESEEDWKIYKVTFTLLSED